MSLAAGTRFGPYEIVSPLGSGGMAEVYRAHDPKLGRDVALKVLPSAGADRAGLARFAQEARAASALNHPNIVTVYDIGQEEEIPFIAMELVDGKSLRELLKGGPLPTRKSLLLAAQVADGLAKAHDAGIVHRDLKPDNVMVTKDGFVKVLDFGVAKLNREGPAAGGLPSTPADGSAITAPGLVVGTAAYMSPEQARGDAVDFRSDQFALGSLLYEMLTGERAFHRGTPVQTMAAIVDEEPEPVTAKNPRLAPPVRWIVERCHAKDPEDRYASTRDLARDLKALEGRLSETASAATAAFAPSPGARKRTLRLAVTGAACALAGAAVALLLSYRPERDPPSLQPLTYSGGDFSPAVSPDGKTLAFASSRDGVPRLWLKTLPAGAEAPLTAGPDDFPRFSPDGAQLLFIRQEGNEHSLYRVPLLGGEPRKLLESVVHADWMPDGRQVLYVRWQDEAAGRTSVLGLLDAEAGSVSELLRVPDQSLLFPRVSPDGHTAAFIGSALSGVPGAVLAVDLRARTLRSLTPPAHGVHFSSAAWSGDGRSLMVLRSESATPFVVNTNRAARLLRLSAGGGPGDGQTLLFTPGFGSVIDVAGVERLVLETRAVRGNLREVLGSGAHWLTRGSSVDRQPFYTPSGEEVVFSSNRNGNWDLWAVATRTGSVRNLTEHRADDWDPSLTDGGRKLLFSSSRSGHFEVYVANADGTQPRQLSQDGVDAENPTATPDGSVVVYNSSNPTKAGIWKVPAGGGPAAQLVAGRTFLPEVSPDGQHVLYVTNVGANVPVVRVARLADGAAVDFEIRAGTDRLGTVGTGRARWMPDGKAIAFLGLGEHGQRTIYVQDFRPGVDTAASRRPLPGLPAELNVDTFGISPDGKRVAVEHLEELSSVMSAEGVPGVRPPR